MYTINSQFKPSDFNRIEQRCVDLYDHIVNDLGIILNTYPGDDVYPGNDVYPSDFPAPSFKINWLESDPPFLDEVDRIKQNIIIIGGMVGISPALLNLTLGRRFFNYDEANKLDLAINYIEDNI